MDRPEGEEHALGRSVRVCVCGPPEEEGLVLALHRSLREVAARVSATAMAGVSFIRSGDLASCPASCGLASEFGAFWSTSSILRAISAASKKTWWQLRNSLSAVVFHIAAADERARRKSAVIALGHRWPLDFLATAAVESSSLSCQPCQPTAHARSRRQVAYLHENGVAHRDLKFENCLLVEVRSSCARLPPVAVACRGCLGPESRSVLAGRSAQQEALRSLGTLSGHRWQGSVASLGALATISTCRPGRCFARHITAWARLWAAHVYDILSCV